MCHIYNGYEIDNDVSRVINKYDIYLCNLGEIETNKNKLGKTRPCIIISSDDNNNALSDQYTVIPIRTEHSTEVTDDNAESIVLEKKQKGRIYVPIKFGANDIRFADVTQLTQVSCKDIITYIKTMINPNTRRRLDIAVDDLINGTSKRIETDTNDFVKKYFNNTKSPTSIMNDLNAQRYIYDIVKNFGLSMKFGDIINEEYNYATDVSTSIKKFDIWTCYSTKEQNRKDQYVILQSNKFNMDRQNLFLVAPIYKESSKNVTTENVDEFVKEIFDNGNGRLYVPFKPTGGDIMFINIGKITNLSIDKFISYDGHIINKDIRKAINEKINWVYSLDDEDESTCVEETNTFESVSVNITKTPKTSAKKTRVRKKKRPFSCPMPDDFGIYYEKYKNKKMTADRIATKNKVSKSTFYRWKKEYEEKLKTEK